MSSQSSATKSHLGAAGIGLGAYAAFYFVLYWLMQPTVTANSGLAGYRPPPKTIVKYADAPWEPPNSPEALPIRAVDEPAPVIPKRSVTEEPKKETIRHLLLRQELDAAQGLLLTAAFYWDLNDQTRAWAKKFADRYPKVPTMIHAGTYGAVTHYLKAVAAAGTDDGGAVVARMNEMPVDDATATGSSISRMQPTHTISLFYTR
jgi:substrate-binding family protein